MYCWVLGRYLPKVVFEEGRGMAKKVTGKLGEESENRYRQKYLTANSTLNTLIVSGLLLNHSKFWPWEDCAYVLPRKSPNKGFKGQRAPAVDYRQRI